MNPKWSLRELRDSQSGLIFKKLGFVSFEKGVVKVKLKGSCVGCPSSMMTLKQGVQNLLKHYVKGVNSVEAI